MRASASEININAWQVSPTGRAAILTQVKGGLRLDAAQCELRNKTVVFQDKAQARRLSCWNSTNLVLRSLNNQWLMP
jgi:hypothetical protein